jgi:ribosomal protein S18 acetylase RimI-like enzyme
VISEATRPHSTARRPLLSSRDVGQFFIDYEAGRVATRDQLAEAGVVASEVELPPRPWHPMGPGDASTMWYAAMRKRTRGVFIGTMCIRHTERQAELEAQGWEEVPIEEIGLGGRTGAAG